MAGFQGNKTKGNRMGTDRDENASGVATIHTSLPQHRSSGNSEEPKKRATIMVLLAKLAVHYYRPDFTEGQAKSLISDMVHDLVEFDVPEVELAIREYQPQTASERYAPDHVVVFARGALETALARKRHPDRPCESLSDAQGPEGCGRSSVGIKSFVIVNF